MRRQLSVAVFAVLVGTVALSGCDRPAQQTTRRSAPRTEPAIGVVASSRASADRAAVLARAAAAITTSSAHLSALIVTPTTYLTVRADIDPIKKTTHVIIAGNQAMEIIAIGADGYVKAAGLSKKPWLHVNLAKLPKTSALRAAATGTDSLGILGGVVSVTDAGDQQLRGTTNLRKAAANAPDGAVRANLEALAKLIGPTATKLPFNVTLDEQGRLRTVGFDLTTAQGEAVNTELHVWSYGKLVKVTVPSAAEIEEATPAQYKRL